MLVLDVVYSRSDWQSGGRGKRLPNDARHWFTPELSTFVGAEERLPFDQHQLVALAAPRPVLLVDGETDD